MSSQEILNGKHSFLQPAGCACFIPGFLNFKLGHPYFDHGAEVAADFSALLL